MKKIILLCMAICMLAGFTAMAEKENVALGGTVAGMMFSDTALSVDYGAHKIIDGNDVSMMYLGNKYGAVHQWVKIDLNGYYDVSEIEFVSSLNGDGGAVTQMADIYISSEDVSVENMTCIGGAPADFTAGGTSYTVKPSGKNITRYVAIKVRNAGIFKCAELKVYAEKSRFSLSYDKENAAFKVSGKTDEKARVMLMVDNTEKSGAFLSNIDYVDGMNAVVGAYNLTVPTANLKNTTYDFIINESGENTVQSSVTAVFGEMSLKNFVINTANGTVKAEALIANYSKTSGDRPVMHLAVYEGDKLKNVVISNKATVEAGDLAYYYVTANVEEGTTAKAFIWNSTEGLAPLGSAIDKRYINSPEEIFSSGAERRGKCD